MPPQPREARRIVSLAPLSNSEVHALAGLARLAGSHGDGGGPLAAGAALEGGAADAVPGALVRAGAAHGAGAAASGSSTAGRGGRRDARG